MNWLRKTQQWFKKHWKWVVGGLVLILTIFAGVKYRKQSTKAKVNRHKIKVLKAEREIAKLEGKREVIRNLERDTEVEVKIIDSDIGNLNDKIASSKTEVVKLTSEEKLKAFKGLGY